MERVGEERKTPKIWKKPRFQISKRFPKMMSFNSIVDKTDIHYDENDEEGISDSGGTEDGCFFLKISHKPRREPWNKALERIMYSGGNA